MTTESVRLAGGNMREPRSGACCRWGRTLVGTVIILVATACTHQPARWSAGPDAGQAVGADIRVAGCREALATARAADGAGLDGAGIRVLSWNVQKKHGSAWRHDFDRLSSDADLVLIQEASLAHHAHLAAGRHASFAPGYRTGDRVTGVLTFSRNAPLVRCSFTSREPWLQTPKSTSITTYALDGSDERLAVVNIHAVNFALGLSDYRAQFARVFEVLHDHPGPIILAGDFNTWRGRRLAVVTELASALQLRAVSFTDDERVRFFGRPLDHIYVRNLELRQSGTDSVTTSDHNPMTAVLAMPLAAAP